MPTAFITGGAGAIGGASARVLARDGWRVVLADIDGDELKRVAADIGAAVAGTFVLDATDSSAVHSAIEQAAEANGLDGLVTAAGGLHYIPGAKDAPFTEPSPESWNPLTDVLPNPVSSPCHAVLPLLYHQKTGSIVNIASGAGLRGGPPHIRQRNASVYSAAKAGVVALTQSIAQEAASHGVRVHTGAARPVWARPKSWDRLG